MNRKIEVLDHGSIELVESWGSDERIVETARVSTQKGFQGWGAEVTCSRCSGRKYFVAWGDSDRDEDDDPSRPCPACHGAGVRIEKPGDEKLLRYLAEHHHDTPFEFAGAVFEVQAPIFVFREWHRHRTQSYSEASARYNPLPDVHYVPTVERLMAQGGANRQAGAVSGKSLSPHDAEMARLAIECAYAEAEDRYRSLLDSGTPKELARLVMPVGRYSRMRATANLRNWIGFLALRCAPNAQWEIRQYANAVRDVLAETFPRTMALFAG